jgi:hypothetical protein
MGLSMVEMWHSMGFAARAVVFVLAAMSIYVVAVSIERYRFYAQGRKFSDALVAANEILGSARIRLGFVFFSGDACLNLYF